MEKCKLCEEEYNVILPTGYCARCQKALDAQQRQFAKQMLGGGQLQAQATSDQPTVYN